MNGRFRKRNEREPENCLFDPTDLTPDVDSCEAETAFVTQMKKVFASGGDWRQNTPARIVAQRERAYREFELQSVASNVDPKRAKMAKFLGRKDIVGGSTDPQHWSIKNLTQLTARDYNIMREDFGIKVKAGEDVPPPIRCWAEARLPRGISRVLRSAFEPPWTDPSPIQMQALPIAYRGRDMVALAETGSGKTAAYGIPIAWRVSELPRLVGEACLLGPYALILAPSQELVQQIHDVVRVFATAINARTLCAKGGTDMASNFDDIQRGVEIIVGTPGRIANLLENKYLVLSQCKMVVLDEADRALDSGLNNQVLTVLQACPDTHQSMLFSATMPKACEAFIAQHVSPTAVRLNVGTTSSNITQVVTWLNPPKKDEDGILVPVDLAEKTIDIVRTHPSPAIIFCNSKARCDQLSLELDSKGLDNVAIHSDLKAEYRAELFREFKEGKRKVLIASDALARGIDIPDVGIVLNYDAPAGDDAISKYIHRIGRTGRAGKAGKAIVFLTEMDRDILCELRRYLVECRQVVPEELEAAYQKIRLEAAEKE